MLRLACQWNAFVELLPLWIAPNMVTLMGFMCILCNVGVLVVMMPDLEGPVSAANMLLSRKITP